ncbi:Bone morphogenetic protein 1 [Desmophyllum pertusum]|uniref:Bone morphogenetic protein 1 n=1 Tax=Desmophyllum pertusum TaxID=174260 RepID=A0A9W9ZJJ4_9CNID|nr:Bone morphogenetic protein 1 [Desmophyllum pertusum]
MPSRRYQRSFSPILRTFVDSCSSGYHRDCDDISHVTPEMMTFLGRITDSVVEVASNMTNEKCEVKQVDCIEEKTADKGEIMTPYYNTQYPNKLDCAWTISESVNCTADYVNIRDGKDKTAPLIGRYCGKTQPEPVKASAQSLYIMFHTDELDAFKGFKAEWSSTPVDKSTA